MTREAAKTWKQRTVRFWRMGKLKRKGKKGVTFERKTIEMVPEWNIMVVGGNMTEMEVGQVHSDKYSFCLFIFH